MATMVNRLLHGVNEVISAVGRLTVNRAGLQPLPSSNKNVSDCSSLDSAKQLRKPKTPVGKLDQDNKLNAASRKPDPFAPFPDNTNPLTGEIGGPTGPEPTRYGDWERKGRVSDF